MYDVSDANPHFGPFGELIPDGTFAKLQMKIKPGNANGLEPADNGLLTGDFFHIADSVLHYLAVTERFTDTHVKCHLGDARHLHHILVTKLLQELFGYFIAILVL